MILAGGLLRLYWDSGPPPAQGDGFPLGLENVARPNVNIRWGNRAPEIQRPVPPPPPPPRPAEADAVPVPLGVAVRVAAASSTANRAALQLSAETVIGAAALAHAQACRPGVLAVAVPQLTAPAANAVPAAACGAVSLHVDDATRRRLTQRERNRRAIELALRLLDDE